MARFNNVKNICVLKDSICQGGRPKNSRTCMLVGWGSRHFAAEAMELKVPAKVLICNFVLPREQMWSLSTTPSSPLTTWCNYSTHSLYKREVKAEDGKLIIDRQVSFFCKFDNISIWKCDSYFLYCQGCLSMLKGMGIFEGHH